AATLRTMMSACTRCCWSASSPGHQSDSSSICRKSGITLIGRQDLVPWTNCRVGDNYTAPPSLDLARRVRGWTRTGECFREFPCPAACAKLASAPSRRLALREFEKGEETMAGSAAAARLAQLGETTFPRLLARHAAERPGAPAMREKDLGIWQAMSWAELKAEVEIVAAGLSAAGFERGAKLALIGENRPRL